MSALPSSIAWSSTCFQRLVAGQVDSLLAGQVAQFGLDVAEAGAAAAQQRVGELDQPGMPADGAHQQPPVLGVQVAQGGQAQEQPPQLRTPTAAGGAPGPGTGPGRAAGTGR